MTIRACTKHSAAKILSSCTNLMSISEKFGTLLSIFDELLSSIIHAHSWSHG